MTMRAVIIEDEIRSQNVLKSLLDLCSPEIDVVGMADSVEKGKELILESYPDLIFLDVQLKDGLGFDLLEQLDDLEFHIIFTTAYDQYAIKAFRFSAVDYLIKPLDISELKSAIKRIKRQNLTRMNQEKISNLLRNLSLNQSEEPILSVSTMDNIEFIKIHDIIRAEAKGAYTYLILKDKRKTLISKVIKELDQLLSAHSFYRIHQSHLVNLREIKKYFKRQNELQMSDDSFIPISRTKKEGFLERVAHLRI